jgi:hypothetical protein
MHGESHRTDALTLEKAMSQKFANETSSQFCVAAASISPAGIDAIIRKANAERARDMRAAFLGFGAQVKRLVAALRPICHRVPHRGEWQRSGLTRA